jgi:hypothetical protein
MEEEFVVVFDTIAAIEFVFSKCQSGSVSNQKCSSAGTRRSENPARRPGFINDHDLLVHSLIGVGVKNPRLSRLPNVAKRPIKIGPPTVLAE